MESNLSDEVTLSTFKDEAELTWITEVLRA